MQISKQSGEQISSLDKEKIREIAQLARLILSDTEIEAFSHQFTTIIDYFNLLRQANVEGVPPTNSLQGSSGQLRQDVVTAFSNSEEFLLGLPRRQGRYIKVASILPKRAKD
jgi:aspartyl/glutamyl-tRNA(Asn/Gln) amidotransferase C subunit